MVPESMPKVVTEEVPTEGAMVAACMTTIAPSIGTSSVHLPHPMVH
jgi:hypothetical protein